MNGTWPMQASGLVQGTCLIPLSAEQSRLRRKRTGSYILYLLTAAILPVKYRPVYNVTQFIQTSKSPANPSICRQFNAAQANNTTLPISSPTITMGSGESSLSLTRAKPHTTRPASNTIISIGCYSCYRAGRNSPTYTRTDCGKSGEGSL